MAASVLHNYAESLAFLICCSVDGVDNSQARREDKMRTGPTTPAKGKMVSVWPSQVPPRFFSRKIEIRERGAQGSEPPENFEVQTDHYGQRVDTPPAVTRPPSMVGGLYQHERKSSPEVVVTSALAQG